MAGRVPASSDPGFGDSKSESVYFKPSPFWHSLPTVRGLAIPFALLGWLTAGPAATQDDVQARIQEIVGRGEQANPDRIRELANLRTNEALEGLLRAYDVMQSIYMRRAVLQGLALFDDVSGLERKALQKILDAATTSSEAEMRAIAVDLLADCPNYGQAFLAMIVESAAEEDVRELALRHHAGNPRPEDLAWYRELLKNGGSKPLDPAEVEAGARKPRRLEVLREIAFEALRGDLSVGELATFLSDPDERIRGLALEELGARKDPAALGIARNVFEQEYAPPRDRLRAARILASVEGARIADRLIELSTEGDASEELAFGIADLLAKAGDPEIDAKLLKRVGRGKGLELRFSLRAARNLRDTKVDEVLIELADAKDPHVRREALGLLGERRTTSALSKLEKLLSRAKAAEDVGALLAAIGRIRGNDPEWLDRLAGYAESEDLAVRNGVLEALGATGDERWLTTLVNALGQESWSTRLVAARALEKLRTRQGTWALVTRLEKESGRMAVELSGMLFRLTGKPFGTNARLWADWWKSEGHALDPLDPDSLAKAERAVESKRLREVTRSTFFGLRVLSERVTFVIDVSGSMLEPTRGRYVDEQGEARIEKAKEELIRTLGGLARTALFNIVTFSDGVSPFAKHSQEVNEKTLANAEQFVRRLGARGGTNLYGALSFALGDPDVDTIYVLSDGEPSVGELVDAGAIRAAIARRNEHRGVEIHCVAIGGALHLLEWLAQDSGGTYVQFP